MKLPHIITMTNIIELKYYCFIHPRSFLREYKNTLVTNVSVHETFIQTVQQVFADVSLAVKLSETFLVWIIVKEGCMIDVPFITHVGGSVMSN